MYKHLVGFILCSATAAADTPAMPLALQGTWTLSAAYETRADGTRTYNYGEHPHGLLIVDADGRYSLQIFRADRPRFASADKTRGSAEEYRAAVTGASTHIGRVHVDAAAKRLVFDIESASFPNWQGTQQVRDFSYANGTLTYAVPASASGNGSTAYSVWQRAGN